MIKNANGNIELTEKEYKSLLDDQRKLRALENAGVDNWEWYDFAMEDYYGTNEDV